MMNRVKAKPIPIKLKKPLEKFLRKEAKRTNKTMVAIIEELLEYKRCYKDFPAMEKNQ